MRVPSLGPPNYCKIGWTLPFPWCSFALEARFEKHCQSWCPQRFGMVLLENTRRIDYALCIRAIGFAVSRDAFRILSQMLEERCLAAESIKGDGIQIGRAHV